MKSMRSQLPVYLLAGGKSSRFGSDKARALLGAKPLLLRQAEILAPIATSLTVIADKAGKYADLGQRTLADLHPGAGPLAGLETALADCRQEWLLLASCDCYGISRAQLDELLTAPRAGKQAVAFKNEFWQPLLALYHRGLLPEVRHRLDQGRHALWRLLAEVETTKLDGADLNWLQINRPADLRLAETLLPGQDV